jgi:hypothetical protein
MFPPLNLINNKIKQHSKMLTPTPKKVVLEEVKKKEKE